MASLRISGGTVVLPTGCVTNETVSTASGDIIDCDKLQHLFKAGSNFGLAATGTPTNTTHTLHIASIAGTVRAFHCGCYDTGTSASITFDLLKNGTTMLSAAVTVSNADSDRAIKDGTLSSTAVAADDWLTCQIVINTTTGMTGPYAWVEIEEAAA